MVLFPKVYYWLYTFKTLILKYPACYCSWETQKTNGENGCLISKYVSGQWSCLLFFLDILYTEPLENFNSLFQITLGEIFVFYESYYSFFLFKLSVYFILFHMSASIFYVPYAYSAQWIQKWASILWNFSYRWLLGTMLAMGSDSRFSTRTLSTICQWPISLDLWYFSDPQV